MYGVVAAQRELLGEATRFAGELRVNADQREFGLKRLELLQGPPVGCRGEVPAAKRGIERRAALRIGKDAARYNIWRGPKFRDELRAILDDQKLD
jgi:hypothetical protein